MELNQFKYINDVLKRYGMKNCKPISTSHETRLKLTKNQSPRSNQQSQKMAEIPYKSIVWSLMYVMVCTQQDIAHSMGVVSQYLANLRVTHRFAIKIIMHHLKRPSITHGLIYKKNHISILYPKWYHGYSNINWANDIDTIKSTFGYIFILSLGTKSWTGKRQTIIYLFSTEAKYMACTLVAKEQFG
jgi:hypothetical protein